ncbi:hypothetical protein TNCV_989761 [Trichonephila clavipes]|nr:hypothetical protein TNCV_989761 [Trichonephila clavipes]
MWKCKNLKLSKKSNFTFPTAVILPQSLSRGEGSFLFIVRVEFYLPTPAFEILGKKPGIAGKCVQRVIYPWQSIAVLLGDVIQPTIVHTESG